MWRMKKARQDNVKVSLTDAFGAQTGSQPVLSASVAGFTL